MQDNTQVCGSRNLEWCEILTLSERIGLYEGMF